ncbi:MAG: ATP-dependent DNA helicase RecG [Cyclobacteriaceae bacterium]|nr:ATP-dependent DNA helicase RecG [Cyclobacteriaceae bacterium]
MPSFFDTPIEFLKGVGPRKGELLRKELALFTFGDMIRNYPFRYEDRSRTYSIGELSSDMHAVQIRGRIRNVQLAGQGRKKRLVAWLNDGTGEIELVWFKGVQWVARKVHPGVEYVVFGKPALFGSKLNIAHPEIEPATRGQQTAGGFHPVYSSTDKLRNNYLDSKALSRLQHDLLQEAYHKITDPLPPAILNTYGLTTAAEALRHVHFPTSKDNLAKARYRLKFEEFFFIQLKLLSMKQLRLDHFKGEVFSNTELLTRFYEEHLPFTLTDAQKRVIREVYRGMKSGKQMNRLLQGDVGSGKTIVAFICMLLVLADGAQAALMAPTEILAIQHYNGLKDYAQKMGLTIALLTGSTKQSEKKTIRQMLAAGDLHIIVGTHALIEDKVKFKKLGLSVVDEQHRFGVEQRSKLWQKNQHVYPHILVMTATPIPRTLAMTLYGDLDISVIDELPKGRKPIKTIHHYDAHRLKVNGFIKSEVGKGRQVYIVYPLIEESEKMDLKDLMDGYESVCRAFPDYAISIVHGKMKPQAKDWEMQRFVKGETQIMVATTVIEVGVDVPNASVMVIENAERFGLAQLHQLRGRVGRGAEQSYCVLMTKYELSKEARLRVETMVRTNNGFEIADVDLNLRGPGDLAGTQQSGVADLKMADLSTDGKILQVAREAAIGVMTRDPGLIQPENSALKGYLEELRKSVVTWSRVS